MPFASRTTLQGVLTLEERRIAVTVEPRLIVDTRTQRWAREGRLWSRDLPRDLFPGDTAMLALPDVPEERIRIIGVEPAGVMSGRDSLAMFIYESHWQADDEGADADRTGAG